MTAFRPAKGTEFYLNGEWHLIESVDHRAGSLTVVDRNGVLTTMSVEDLINHRSLTRDDDRLPPQDLVARLPEADRQVAIMRIEHANEAMTGFRSGDPNVALPGEPKPEYDPATTFQKDRLAAKHAELDTEFARLLGVDMSVRTIRRLGTAAKDGTVFATAAGSHGPRRVKGRRAICREVAEETFRVVEDRRQLSNKTVRGMHVELRRRLMEQGYGEAWMGKNFPEERTWRRFVHDYWTPSELTGKSRTRASGTVAPVGGFRRMNPTRPGQIVFMDTNSLDVLLKGTAIEGAVRGSVVVGLDQFSRSVCSVRVVEQAEKNLDIGFALLDLAKPKQMKPDWPDDARWPFVGIPEGVLGTSATGSGVGIAGLPIVNPESLGLDHGGPYKAHKTRELAARYGIDILPARTYTGSDKAWIERFFGALRTMLLEHLEGYRGSDTSERGKNTDNEVEWTAQRLEDLIALWAVRMWQTHIMEGVRPSWCPEGHWSPNSLYQHGIETAGLSPRLMTSSDFYGVITTTYVKVHSRGVNVRGLWYDNDPDTGETVLDSRRNQPAPTGNKKWTVQYDRRDLRHVWFVDEFEERHLLRWVGATGDFPSFSDRHINALRNRIDGQIRQYDSHELAEILLTEVLPVRTPEGWIAGDKAANKAASAHARDRELAVGDAANYAAAESAPPEPEPEPATALEAKRKERRQRATGGNPSRPAATPAASTAARLSSTPSSMLDTIAALRKDQS